MASLDEVVDHLRRAAGEADDNPRKQKNPMPVEGQLANLRETAQRYKEWRVQGCAFEEGDLVTPRSTSTMVHLGDPFIVLEVRRPTPEPYFGGLDDGTPRFGTRLDMRVAHVHKDGEVIPHWVESFEFEPFAPPA